MGAWEIEVLLLGGPWKNIEHLEECLNLPEIQALLKGKYETEERTMRFQAGLKGIDLGQNDDTKDRFEAAQRRALARQTGKSVDAIEFDELGIDFIEE